MRRRWGFGGTLLLLAVAVCCAARGAGAADGAFLIGIGPKQNGLAGAGVASPSDSHDLLLNPALLVELEPRLDVSLDVILPRRELRPAGIAGNPFAGDMLDTSPVCVPELGAILHCGERSACGAGVFGLSGLTGDYPRSRSIAPALLGQNWDRRVDLQVGRLAAAYSRRLESGWRVGLTLNLNVARLQTDHITTKSQPPPHPQARDYALGAGFTVGAYRRFGRLHVGASYTSRQWMQSFDRYDTLIKGSLDLPQWGQAGLAWDATPKLRLMLDYRWIDWSGVAALGDEPKHGGFSWQDEHVVKLAAEYRLSDGWTLRAGVSHGTSPLRDDRVYVNGLASVLSTTHAAVGATWRPAPRHEIHLAFRHGFHESLTETGRGGLYSWVGRGTRIALRFDAVTVGYTYRF